MTDTLSAGAARFYSGNALPISPTFTGTLAVSAAGQVALEILHLETITGGNAILEVVDESTMNDFAHTPIDRCTVLWVHNPFVANIVLLEVYQADGTAVITRTYSILPEGLRRIVPLQDLGLPPDFLGSAVLMAVHPIQVTAFSRCRGLSAFVAPSQGSTRLFFPYLPPSIPGRITATLTIRNVSTTIAEGEIIYAAGVTAPLKLPPAGSVSMASPTAYFIYLPLVGKGYPLGGGMALSTPISLPHTYYSGLISTTAPVAAVAQVIDIRSGGGVSAYRLPSFEDATPAVALPILFAGYEDWWTGNRIWVRNLGVQTAAVQMRYVTVPTGTVIWDSLPYLSPGETAQVSMPPLPDGANLAAAIFLADQPIVARAGALNVRPDTPDRHIGYLATNFHFTCRQVESADFIWSPSTPTVGEMVSFSAFFTPITATPPISYTWNWGDGTTGTGNPASHIYTQPGTYTVTVTVQNCLGFGQALGTRTVTVGPRPISSSAPILSCPLSALGLPCPGPMAYARTELGAGRILFPPYLLH